MIAINQLVARDAGDERSRSLQTSALRGTGTRSVARAIRDGRPACRGSAGWRSN